MSENKLASKILIRALTAGTVAQRVCSSNKKRTRVYVQVTDSGTCYITSGQNQPYTQGMKCSATLPYENVTATAELWVITSSSTAACAIEEDTD